MTLTRPPPTPFHVEQDVKPTYTVQAGTWGPPKEIEKVCNSHLPPPFHPPLLTPPHPLLYESLTPSPCTEQPWEASGGSERT